MQATDQPYTAHTAPECLLQHRPIQGSIQCQQPPSHRVKEYSQDGAGRSNKGSHRRSSVSFPIVRAQFSALPVEDRLEFLSWLFEGALSHCISTPLSTDATVLLSLSGLFELTFIVSSI